MYHIELLRMQLNHLMDQARQDVYTEILEPQTLHRIWDTLSMIHDVSESLAHHAYVSYHYGTFYPSQISPTTPAPNPQPAQRTFTVEELATFNGKNGKAAYVAV